MGSFPGYRHMAASQGLHPRKLAVILHADVAGSTALVHLNESLAHDRITHAFNRFAKVVELYRGTVQEVRGDALIANFERASDAVCAALDFQQRHSEYLKQFNDEIKPAVRIGVSLGEVVFADDTVTGAGVVMAQRDERLAEPGGLCITAAIHEALPNRMPFVQKNLGEQKLKGFDEGVRVYGVGLIPGELIPPPEHTRDAGSSSRIWTVVTAAVVITLVITGALFYNFYPREVSEEPVSVEQTALPLPDKPSIAVLPFTNMSNDAEQEYFVDGMTEDIITDLAKLSGLFVIARNTVFTYKNKSVQVRKVAAELGVRYVLEGSVRRVGDQVRINAQLIDATTGGHLWAERYDGALTDIFRLQDQVTEKIVAALAVNLTGAEKAGKKRVETSNPEAYDAFLKGWAHYRRQTPDDFSLARDYLERAIQLDPDYSRAYAALATLYWETHIRSWFAALKLDRERVKERAYWYRDKALADPTSLAYVIDAEMLMWVRRHDKAITQVKRALELAPNDAYAQLKLAEVLVYAGQPRKALESVATAVRLDPRGEPRQLYIRGLAEFGLEAFDKAAASLQRTLELNPEFAKPTAILTAAYGYLGQRDAAKLLEPYQTEWWGVSVSTAVLQFPFQREKDRQRLAEGLRKAGLREIY